MHPRLAVLACLLGLLPAPETAAEILPEPATRTVKSEAARLIQQDFRDREAARRARPAFVPEPRGSGEVLQLPTFVVREKPPPQLPPPPLKETKLGEFFRTGTILQNRSGSIRLWMKGDQGLMLTFPF